MNSQIEVRHLRLMVAIFEEGTVSRAAERLFLTQSALSHQLRDIETKLGTELFLRLKKRMVLTPAGERFIESAQKLLRELKIVEEDIRAMSSSAGGGVIRLSTECYTCYHWLPSVLRAFNDEYPNVQVQIVVESTRDPIHALVAGKIDLAIVHSEVRNDKLLADPLFEDECVAIVYPSHRLSDRRYLVPKDFSDEHLLTYASPTETLFFQTLLTPNGIIPKKVSPVMLTEAIIEMVKAGLGIAVLARWAVRPQVEAGEVIAIPLTRTGMVRQWSAVARKTENTSDHLSHFTKLLKQAIPELP